MKSTLLTLSSLALAASIFVPSARAQINYTSGDLLVGFESPTANYDYIVDIGSYTKFASSGIYATGQPVVVLSGSAFLSDLSGAGLSSGTFGIFSGVSGSFSAVDGSQMESSPGTQTTALAGMKSSTFGTVYGQFNTVALQFNSGADTQHGSQPDQSLGSAPNSLLQNISSGSGNPNIAPNNWAASVPTDGVAFEYFQPPVQGAYAATGAGDVLDLYQYNKGSLSTPGATSLVGEFEFNNGQLIFDSASAANASFPLTPTPEPSSFAALLGGLAMLAAARHRSR